MSFQEIITHLNFSSKKLGCVILPAYDTEICEESLTPIEFFKSIENKPWASAQIVRCRIKNEFQYRVLLIKDEGQEYSIRSLLNESLDLPVDDMSFSNSSVSIREHEILRFFSPGIFGIKCSSSILMLYFLLEKIALYKQEIRDTNLIQLNTPENAKQRVFTYREVYAESKNDFCKYHRKLNERFLSQILNYHISETEKLIAENLLRPAYDNALKSIYFLNLKELRWKKNILDERNRIAKLISDIVFAYRKQL